MNGKEKVQLGKLDQKLSDFLKTYDEHHQELKTYMTATDDRLGKLERLRAKVEQPFKWVGGVVTVASIGMFTVVGEKTARWLYSLAKHAGR